MVARFVVTVVQQFLNALTTRAHHFHRSLQFIRFASQGFNSRGLV